MALPQPAAADERGIHEGRPFEIRLPRTAPPWPGIVILHGAGSRKENHGDFARAAQAGGWAALTYDQRGHGASADEMTPAAITDVARMAGLLATREGVDPGRVCARGSSMGGLLAIHAAAASSAIAGVIAICPATEDGLRRGLRRGDFGFPADTEAMDAWLGEHDAAEAIARISPRPVILFHARGDEQVPYTASERLHAAAGEPKRLIVMPGGHHRSIQHDAELQGVSLEWMRRKLGI